MKKLIFMLLFTGSIQGIYAQKAENSLLILLYLMN